MSYGKYDVVVYPLYYAVVDLSTPQHDIVFETRNRLTAHRRAKKLDKLSKRAEQRYIDAITGVNVKDRDRLIKAMSR